MIKITMMVWQIRGDPNELLFKTEVSAEIYAATVFPDENAAQRFARIYFVPVYTATPERRKK